MQLSKEESKIDKALVLKSTNEDESDDNDLDVLLFFKFKRFVKKSRNGPKGENYNKSKHINKSLYDGCYKCIKLDYMAKVCPTWK